MYEYMACCTNVVDGDTVDLLIDLGFRQYTHQRIRLLGVNAPEMNSKDEVVRKKALEAKEFVVIVLSPRLSSIPGSFPLRIQTTKADSFGRYLSKIWYHQTADVEVELGAKLLELKLAEPYT